MHRPTRAAHHQFCFFLPYLIDDKGEAAPETRLRLRPAEQVVGREVRQQPAAAGGRREGSAAHRPQHGGQELQQEEHLQPPQVKTAAWLNDLGNTKRLSVESSVSRVSIWSRFYFIFKSYFEPAERREIFCPWLRSFVCFVFLLLPVVPGSELTVETPAAPG